MKSISHQPPWRNWLARSAVNRKVGGSSPPGGDFLKFYRLLRIVYKKNFLATFSLFWGRHKIIEPITPLGYDFNYGSCPSSTSDQRVFRVSLFLQNLLVESCWRSKNGQKVLQVNRWELGPIRMKVGLWQIELLNIFAAIVNSIK